jgi:hypothetical protein
MKPIDQLKEIAENSTGHTFHRIVKKNKDLHDWIMSETKESLPDANISEKSYFLLYGKPSCPHGNERKYLTFTRGYGYCSRPESCQCHKDDEKTHSKEMWKNKTKSEKEAAQKKREKTNIKKYGVSNTGQTPQAIASREKTYKIPARVEEIGRKIKKTKLEKYGDEDWVNTPKRKKTCLERYGVEEHLSRPEVWDTIRKTNMEKYGVEYPSQSPIIREKQKQSMMEKYGVEHALQFPEFFRKAQGSSTRHKDYQFPSGRVESVQGFEPFALDRMLSIESVAENDIQLGCNVPKIPWIDEKGNNRVHYPDIYIQSQNRIVEVKSYYTIPSWNDLLLKKEAAEKLDYVYHVYIFDARGDLIESIR